MTLVSFHEEEGDVGELTAHIAYIKDRLEEGNKLNYENYPSLHETARSESEEDRRHLLRKCIIRAEVAELHRHAEQVHEHLDNSDRTEDLKTIVEELNGVWKKYNEMRVTQNNSVESQVRKFTHVSKRPVRALATRARPRRITFWLLTAALALAVLMTMIFGVIHESDVAHYVTLIVKALVTKPEALLMNGQIDHQGQ